MNIQLNIQSIKDAYKYLWKLSDRVRRYSSGARIDSRDIPSLDIDDLILTDPERALGYFRFEYFVCAFFSFCAVIVTVLFYLFKIESTDRIQHTFLYWWNLFGILLHLANILVKVFVIRWLFNVPQTETLMARRLMLLIRSNLFFWNEKVSFLMYNFFVLGMCMLVSGKVCGSIKNGLFQLSYFAISCFLLRMANLFVRYMVEYGYFTRHIEFDTIINRGLSQKEISDIPVVVYNSASISQAKCTGKKELKNQWCGVCLEYFKDGDVINKFPCDDSHCFHKSCIEVWLKTHNLCPYCRTNLRKSK